MRDREASLESLLSTARSNEERLEKQIRHLEDKELKSNASTEDRLRLLESDRDELSKMNEELRRNATEEQKQHDMEIKNVSFLNFNNLHIATLNINNPHNFVF